MMTGEQYERYARQIALSPFGTKAQEKLLNAAVLVIGAGGLGCPALLYLAGAGIGKIGILDHDKVSLSNLHRQVLYRMEDIGKLKAEVAARALLALNPDIEIKAYPEILNTENAWEIIEEYDLVIDGSDNFATRYLVNDASVLLKKPLVYGAVSGFEGQVAVFNLEQDDGTRSVHYRDLFPNPPQANSIPNCEETGVLGVLPGIIGTMQANEAIKIISGIGEPLNNCLLTFNTLNNQVYTFHISPSHSADRVLPENRVEFEARDYVLECTSPDRAYFEIDVAGFEELYRHDNVIVIDVREEGELPLVKEYTHVNIPLSRMPGQLGTINQETIITICQSGRRSLIAARILADHFDSTRRIYSLAKGIEGMNK